MQLPDEAIGYDYTNALVPPREEWTAAAELRRDPAFDARGWSW